MIEHLLPYQVVEYATELPSGAMQVRAPDIERMYPIDAWIRHRARDNTRVYRRRILVLEDWEEVATDGE
jgi:hypothetical protein